MLFNALDEISYRPHLLDLMREKQHHADILWHSANALRRSRMESDMYDLLECATTIIIIIIIIMYKYDCYNPYVHIRQIRALTIEQQVPHVFRLPVDEITNNPVSQINT